MVENVFLEINENNIGKYRADRIFVTCRSFAQKIAPRCYIMARYENNQRVGWSFEMPTKMAALQLRLYHDKLKKQPAY